MGSAGATVRSLSIPARSPDQAQVVAPMAEPAVSLQLVEAPTKNAASVATRSAEMTSESRLPIAGANVQRAPEVPQNDAAPEEPSPGGAPEDISAAVDEAVVQPGPGATAPSMAEAGITGASSEQIEALADRLLGPLTRRLKAEMLLDRERRGVRTDAR